MKELELIFNYQKEFKKQFKIALMGQTNWGRNQILDILSDVQQETLLTLIKGKK